MDVEPVRLTMRITIATGAKTTSVIVWSIVKRMMIATIADTVDPMKSTVKSNASRVW